MTRQEQLNEAWCKYMGKCSTEILHALAFALRWCDQHPRLISVEDELPPNKGGFSDEVLTYAYASKRYAVAMFCYISNCWFGCDDTVTHWMPLPAPPMEIRGNQRKISPNHQQVIGTADHIKIALDVIDKKGGEQ